MVEAGISLSHVLAAPLAAACLSLDGLGGLAGWRWLFLVEGAPTLLLAGACGVCVRVCVRVCVCVGGGLSPLLMIRSPRHADARRVGVGDTRVQNTNAGYR